MARESASGLGRQKLELVCEKYGVLFREVNRISLTRYFVNFGDVDTRPPIACPV